MDTSDSPDELEQIGVRLRKSQRAELDAWRVANGNLSRNAVIRLAIDAYITPSNSTAGALKQPQQPAETPAIDEEARIALKAMKGALEALLDRTETLEKELAATQQALAANSAAAPMPEKNQEKMFDLFEDGDADSYKEKFKMKPVTKKESQ